MSGEKLADIAQGQQGCVILLWSGCATIIGFVLGLAFAVIWEAGCR